MYSAVILIGANAVRFDGPPVGAGNAVAERCVRVVTTYRAIDANGTQS
jgi:hypothetical protein